MLYREYGQTHEKVSILGFGCMRFPTIDNKIDEEKSTEMIQYALSKGVNYFDTAYTLHEIDEKTFKDILYKHGDDRILFATDCPWRDVKEDLSILRSFNLGKETEEKILYKNAIKLLGI